MKQLARRIKRVEDIMYRAVDEAALEWNVNQTLGFLRTFVADLPAGQALTQRVACKRTDEHAAQRVSPNPVGVALP